MKKSYALLLALCLVFALAACGNGPSAPESSGQTPDTASYENLDTTDILPDENAATADEDVPLEGPAAAPAEGTADAAESASTTPITAEQAESIALADAGVTEADTSYLHTELDRDDGREVYDVEFYAGNTEYDYEIDAATGAILSVDHDIEHYEAPATPSETTLSADEAAAIALEDAGVSKAETSYLFTELDEDDGRLVYEVEFYAGNTEYDYEIDAVTGDILSKDVDVDDDDDRPASGNTESVISADKAKSIALADAGVSESQASRLRAELDRDDGRQVYDVEFDVGTTEYDYEIDAVTGSILSKGVDVDDDDDRPASGNTESVISADKAKSIALADAGVSESQASRLRAGLDRDDGRQVYDVEFDVGTTEYDYEIDAVTGAILSKDVDEDDDDDRPASGNTGNTESVISADKAKSIALADAGVSESQASRLRAELDRDDGRQVYEVEFVSGELEYDYEIDAVTGSILSSDRESIYD